MPRYQNATGIPVTGRAVTLAPDKFIDVQQMSRNKPLGYSTPPDPQSYSSNLLGLKNRPKFYPYSFTYIPSPFNPEYVFHNLTDRNILNKATITSEKGNGDDNNIFKEGQISKVLSECIFPFETVNNNNYNDKTISLFINTKSSLVNQNLSDSTKEALKLVGSSNLISLDLSEDLKTVIYSAVISGNLDLYSPTFFKEMYEAGETVLGNTIPAPTASPLLDFVNAMTYISRNLRSLYAASYLDNGDDSRFAAHWLALPPEYQLALGVTKRVGDPAAIRVGLNFNFPVYERDGTERKVNEFLDFFNVLDKDESTERVVPLRSNRSNLYTLDPAKESRMMGLLGSRVSGDRITRSYEVSVGDLDTVEDIETNADGVKKTLEESYLVKLDLSSLKEESASQDLMRRYSATYNLVWNTGDGDAAFNNVINSPKPVCGPHKVVYLPQDPWWNYFLYDEDNESVKVTFDCLNVEGYLPERYEAIVASQIPYTCLLIPTKDKVHKNPFNGRSVYSNKTRTFTAVISPLTESEIYTTPTKDPTEVNLQGKHDIFALKFSRDVDDGSLSGACVTDSSDYTTGTSMMGEVISRLIDLKANYDLKFEGSDTLTQFDLFKGFSLNQLLEILSISLEDVFTITGVRIHLNKTHDLDTPNSFITEDDLVEGGTPNTTNYIGSDTFPSISYFPPPYTDYN